MAGEWTSSPTRTVVITLASCVLGLAMGLWTGRFLDAQSPARTTRWRGRKAERSADRSTIVHQGEKKDVYVVVLTGGPCGGKTSSLEVICKDFRALGYDVYVAPEVPTALMVGGCVYPGENAGETLEEFEAAVMGLQLQVEESFVRIASSTKRRSIVIFDRGLMDMAAYMPAAMWQGLMKQHGLNQERILQRYDLVIHLVSAANGAEQFYGKATNAQRSEDLDNARALEQRMLECWESHKNRAVIDNHTDFKGKLGRVKDVVAALVGQTLGPEAV